MAKKYNQIIDKIINSGIIQDVEENNGLIQLSFAFEVEGGDELYYYNPYGGTIYDEPYLEELIQYFGSIIVDSEGYIRKAVLESILYKKKNNIKDIIYNPSQVIAKNDKIHLSRLFKKNCLILPYCQTNSSSVWTEVIKFKGKKLIWRRATDKHVSLDYVLRYVGKDDYLSYNILERKIQMEQFMLNLKVKLLSSTLIAKAISNHAEAIKEGANIIAESINSSADSDATALAQFGDVLCSEAFVNLKGYKL